MVGKPTKGFLPTLSSLELSRHCQGNVLTNKLIVDTFTLEEAVNSMGFGRFQVKLSLVTGMCWMADSMEMMILSVLSPALRCGWMLTDYQVASITMSVFVGMAVSAPLWGKFSDNVGRKTALILSGFLIGIYGLTSAFAPTYAWLLLLRCLLGVGLGCVSQGVTLYSEFLPQSHRGRCVVLMDSFWALGACMEVILALFLMPVLGWRWLLGLSSIPLFLFLIASVWLPESARFLAISGRYECALETLRRIADNNGKSMPPGRLTVDDMQHFKKGRLRDLLIPEIRRTTLLLWYIWFVCALSYYGIVLMTTELFQVDDQCHGGSTSIQTESSCFLSCKPLSTADYMDLLWTTLAEFPGMLFTVFLVDKFGRKRTMAAQAVVIAIIMLLLMVCTSRRIYLTILLFLARGTISGIFNAVYLYTPEFYPTTMRSVGIGVCNSVSRLGAMLAPYISQVVLNYSLRLTLGVYASAGLLAGCAALLLPVETKGRQMKDTPT